MDWLIQRFLILRQALTTARSIAAELYGKAHKQSVPSLPSAPRQSSPSPDPLYIKAVMAVLDSCFSTPSQGGQGTIEHAAGLHAHVCWVLGTVRGLLLQQGVQHVAQTLQACILAACDWHATRVSILAPSGCSAGQCAGSGTIAETSH